jgi:hypothetical protein
LVRAVALPGEALRFPSGRPINGHAQRKALFSSKPMRCDKRFYLSGVARVQARAPQPESCTSQGRRPHSKPRHAPTPRYARPSSPTKLTCPSAFRAPSPHEAASPRPATGGVRGWHHLSVRGPPLLLILVRVAHAPPHRHRARGTRRPEPVPIRPHLVLLERPEGRREDAPRCRQLRPRRARAQRSARRCAAAARGTRPRADFGRTSSSRTKSEESPFSASRISRSYASGSPWRAEGRGGGASGWGGATAGAHLKG